MANGAVYVGQWRGDLRDGFGKQAGRDEVRMKWKRLSSLRSSLEAVPKHSVIESKSLGFEFKSTCAEPDSGQVALTFGELRNLSVFGKGLQRRWKLRMWDCCSCATASFSSLIISTLASFDTSPVMVSTL